MITFSVWVGDTPDIEGASAELAQEVYLYWVRQGCDDVRIEEVTA